MNLGFDFDKVFVDYPPFIPSFIIDRLYKKSSDETLLYRIPSKPEQLLRLITHLPYLRPPLQSNIEFVKDLYRKNTYKHFLISSRFSFLKNATNNIVKKHNLEKAFHSMYFNFEDKQPHIFKDAMVKKLNIHRYVDDDLPLLKYLVSKNKKTVFFWLNKLDNKKIDNNLFAITNLKEMVKQYDF